MKFKVTKEELIKAYGIPYVATMTSKLPDFIILEGEVAKALPELPEELSLKAPLCNCNDIPAMQNHLAELENEANEIRTNQNAIIRYLQAHPLK